MARPVMNVISSTYKILQVPSSFPSKEMAMLHYGGGVKDEKLN